MMRGLGTPLRAYQAPPTYVKGGLGMAGQCTRCHRRLTDPVSLKRGMGPVCWAASNGSLFEGDLNASEGEWARRERLLRAGGEIDLGSNWDFDLGEDYFPTKVRVSVRFRNGRFEAYGALANPVTPVEAEVVFAASTDLRSVYEAAVAAGQVSGAALGAGPGVNGASDP